MSGLVGSNPTLSAIFKPLCLLKTGRFFVLFHNNGHPPIPLWLSLPETEAPDMPHSEGLNSILQFYTIKKNKMENNKLYYLRKVDVCHFG